MRVSFRNYEMIDWFKPPPRMVRKLSARKRLARYSYRIEKYPLFSYVVRVTRTRSLLITGGALKK
ncbi:MAG: hypothetical protein EHM64_02965 [Ignavibacteriae bacterium]|nr:MAG: hypothetical protein EHM64_02965 [Ignavibacteriota bacterium]